MRQRLRKRKIGHLEGSVLDALSGGDLLYGFLLSAHSTRRMYRLARERAASRYRQKQALDRLIRTGLARRKGDVIAITPEGRAALALTERSTKQLLHTKQWDGKWRIVSFDIPQEHAHLRRIVRGTLKRAGFLLLQQSLWVFPHDCEGLAELIQRESKLRPHILYGVLERIQGDAKLLKAFRL